MAPAAAVALTTGAPAAEQTPDAGIRELRGRTLELPSGDPDGARHIAGVERGLIPRSRVTTADARAVVAQTHTLVSDVRETTATTADIAGEDRRLVGSRVRWDDGGKRSWVRRLVVRFDFDEDTLRKREREQLEAFAARLAWSFATRIRADGHTDGFGTDSYNDELSARRAMTVCKTLAMRVDVSLPACREEPHGEDDPLADETGPGDVDRPRARNRRVEVIVRLRARATEPR